MPKGFVPAIAIAMFVFAIFTARSDEIPTLDVRPVCQGIASQSGDPADAGLQTTFEQCVQSEQDVREQLKKVWSSFSEADKRHCVTLAKIGGESSNTELLTCLEMARDVRTIRSSPVASSAPAAASTRKATSRARSSPSPSRASLSPAPASPPAASASPSPAPASTSTTQPAPSANEPSVAMVKDLQQAKVDAINARASESIVQRKLADAEADLKQAKEEAGRATNEADEARADAKNARQSKAETDRKLANAEAARIAAEEQEKACQSAAKNQPGFRGWLRGLFGHKPSNPQNP
jgi:hypothetical protein